MKLLEQLLEQRKMLVTHFQEVNRLCGNSENSLGAQRAYMQIKWFDETYKDIIIEQIEKEK